MARIELRRPEVLNALHSDTHRALQAAFDLVEGRDDLGAVILAGAGRAFCTGSDLREVGALRGADSRRYVELDFATKNRVAASPLPVVAAIQGWCVGGGVELALACDIRIAADDAIFSMREVPLGSLPGSGGLQRLPLVVGLGVAKDWILRGVDVPAEEAYRRGPGDRARAPQRTERRGPADRRGAGVAEQAPRSDWPRWRCRPSPSPITGSWPPFRRWRCPSATTTPRITTGQSSYTAKRSDLNHSADRPRLSGSRSAAMWR